jgi:hypothetical protein
VIDREQQQRLLNILLDGLDDLYDQRFGWPPHRPDGPSAEVWLERLLLTASLACDGSPWGKSLGDAAVKISQLLREEAGGTELNDRALEATGDLRTAIAAEA